MSGTEEINIYNSTGNLVFQQSVSNGQEIDIQNLKTGLYFYTLGGKQGKLVVK
jgi:hypothetical protein